MKFDGRVALAVGTAVAVLLGVWADFAANYAPAQPALATAVAPPPSPAPRPSPTRQAQLDRPEELSYARVSVETGGTLAEACLTFSAPLAAGGSVRYEDYLTLTPALRPAIRVDGRRLCLSGLAAATEYAIVMREGLPGEGQRRLAAAAETKVTLGDRAPLVAFGPGFVLPRETLEGLPITTVNIDALAISVYRVGDRLLSQMRRDVLDQRRVVDWDERRIAGAEGKLVWRGKMRVTGPRNETVSSLFALSEAIGKGESGAYLVVARPFDPRKNPDGFDPNPVRDADADEDDVAYSYDYEGAAAQWVVSSDIGLTSFTGADGLTLAARALKTAKPIAGLRLTLIARNNDELGQATTDEAGVARFDPGLLRGAGGMAPVMVMAYGGGDFNFLDLRRPAFDLSDRGVDGRAPAGALDAYLYTERGIYRPGENVHLTGLLRGPAADALTGRTLTIKFLKPDGGEYRRFALRDQGAGGGSISVVLPASAHRGSWRATAHAEPEGPEIGAVGFEVQDFVPQRLAIDIGTRPERLIPGEDFEIPISARFLYGAPAAELGVEADMTIEVDPAPFPRHPGFRWGLVDEKFAGERGALQADPTDEDGRASVAGAVRAEVGRSVSVPLRAEIAMAVREPGGRATSERLYVPIRSRDLAIGIRPHAVHGVAEGREAAFDAIAVDAAGERQAKRLEYVLVRENYTWQWFGSARNWRYERIVRESEFERGTLETSASGPVEFRRVLRWGTYVLSMRDEASGAASSVRFHVGWYGTDSPERPDRLELGADRAGYAPGETAKLRVEADQGGEALVVIANERVHSVRNVTLPAGGGEIEVPIGEWGPGAYALVTLYRPMDDRLGRAPVRAVGVAWLGLDPQRRTFGVAIDAPAKIAPRTTQNVTVRVTGGERAFVTLAAVDQGILQLTRFRSPVPQSHYLVKRRLGVGMRDDYGRLIRARGQGDDQGGDSFGGRGLDVVPTRTVALFSGVVAAGPDGTATIPLAIPDFQGELRLMAVAFGATRLGAAEARMTVRDPVVAEMILPRFLAPGDKGEATVLLHNVEGAAGRYSVAVRMQDAVAGGGQPRQVPLAVGRREVYTVPIEGREAGIGTVELAVSGPGGFAVMRAWPIQVRPAQDARTVQLLGTLAPGETLTLGRDLLDGLVPGTGEVAASVSRLPGLDVPALLRWLDRYPFGCLEQTTSRALPLLYFNDLALLSGAKRDLGIQVRVQDSIDRVLDMQSPEGGFRMWGQWGDMGDPWLGVFALDFLGRAAERGFEVPEVALAAGRRWLGSVASGRGSDARDYAALLLARAGRISAGDLRYFYDSAPPQTAVGLAHLGAALEAVGERARASGAFEAARKRIVETTGDGSPMPYGSRLRDAYIVAATMAAAGRAALVPELLDSARDLERQVDYTTTQEKAWMLMLAAEVSRNAGRLAIEIDGRTAGAGDPLSLPISAAQLARGSTIRNAGTSEVFRTVSVEGVARDPQPAAAEGVTMRKRVLALDGTPLDPASIARNTRFVVLLDGRVERQRRGEFAVVDLLPAGWEIEAVLRPDQPGYEWLGHMPEAQLRQARDDRFVAAVTMPTRRFARDRTGQIVDYSSETWDFAFAYVVRAVTPGEFVLPAASVEHMYAPRIRARTAMARTTVAP
jgi:alpha-2-macroglobulin